MIRRPVPSHASPNSLLALALALVAAVVPASGARSQDRTTQERLDRLERDLTMLQRQVYRGPMPGTGPGSGGAVDTELRMDRLETQMRELTGRVEDAMNGVEQLRRRIEQINSDIDVRFGQAQGQQRSAPSTSHAAAGIADASPAGPIGVRGSTAGANPAPSRAPGSAPPPGTPVSPPRDLAAGTGTLTPPGPVRTPPETANVAAAPGNLRPLAGGLPAASASEQYNIAFGLLKQQDYPAAEEALRAFITQHPNHPQAGSAQYWLGETFYVRGKYTEAASAFAEGYKRYPKGEQAAEDLLKLGMSLARADQKQNACIALAQLDRDFPNPRPAIKDQAIKEKKRLGC